jgi:protein arginine kinase activator
MICEICKEREATVHLTQVMDGQVKKMHICETCAAKSGFDVNGPLSITDILMGMGMKKPESEAAVETPALPVAVESAGLERTCPRCHMRRTDFKKGGRFGCPECYAAFADELPPLLKAMHRSDHHTGKVPAGQGMRLKAAAEISMLQTRLKKAIAAEAYEEAATLRDELEAARRKAAAAGGAP